MANLHQIVHMKITSLKICTLLLIFSLGACNLFQHSRNKAAVTTLDSVSMAKIIDAINQNKMKQSEEVMGDINLYRAAATKTWDLVHTRLDVRFDYAKAQLIGMAIITLKPHAYAQDSLVLDARGMEIQEINDGDSRGIVPLIYHYDGSQITIYLRYHLEPGREKKVVIHYIAKPNEIVVKGSDAITSDKGLYFINNDEKDSLKPRQIWTQGETESNSCWFPTIDKPNQKMTQEINITLTDTQDITLSNGLFKGRRKNSDSTFTDTWAQNIPAAPYLTMMTIGKFYVAHDTWRGKAVDYYVEPEYGPNAMLIFGKTPAMMEYFSKQLGVDFPWEKYGQIVVRDYVSGSMENASATLHGEFLQYDAREYLDDNKEDYISHELFHQWFGDLVTCESWSNLPLNESFATYGEYLWIEHSRGKMAADMHLEDKRSKYMMEALYKQEALIRFQYDDKEDMFDRHSYQKGGCILNLLRSTLGDDVFFNGLKNYLEKNKFKSVEVHDLRLAMEEASGQDLNWFFNQWFLRAGHPKVNASHQYDENEKTETITMEFAKANESNPKLFMLPLAIDFYFKDSVHREKIVFQNWNQTWTYRFSESPLLVNIDAERTMLWEFQYPRNKTELMYQVMHAPLYRDKKEAMELLIDGDSMTMNEKYRMIDYCFSQPYYGIKELPIELLEFMSADALTPYYSRLSDMILNEKNSSFRVSLLQIFERLSEHHDVIPTLRACTNDSSYWVMSEALQALQTKDLGSALKICQANENSINSRVVNTINSIYSDDTLADHSNYFYQSIRLAKGYENNIRAREITNYLLRTTPEFALKTLQTLAPLKTRLADTYTGEYFSPVKERYETLKYSLDEEMKRSRYTEEGYKAVQQKLLIYNQILELLK